MRALLILAIVLCAATGPAPAQRYHREGGYAPKLPPNEAFDRGFFVCRMMYTSVLREAGGIGWQTDYPYSEINFMTRLGELTKTDVELDSTRIPNHYSVRLTDDALFGCPFVIASDIGTAAFTNEEVARLRTYLLKGGFLWVDDFWGTFAWEHWTQELGKVLPPSRSRSWTCRSTTRSSRRYTC